MYRGISEGFARETLLYRTDPVDPVVFDAAVNGDKTMPLLAIFGRKISAFIFRNDRSTESMMNIAFALDPMVAAVGARYALCDKRHLKNDR